MNLGSLILLKLPLFYKIKLVVLTQHVLEQLLETLAKEIPVSRLLFLLVL